MPYFSLILLGMTICPFVVTLDVAVCIFDDLIFVRPQLATTSRAGGMRMAPGRGRGHLCWWSLIFKFFFTLDIQELIRVSMARCDLMTNQIDVMIKKVGLVLTSARAYS